MENMFHLCLINIDVAWKSFPHSDILNATHFCKMFVQIFILLDALHNVCVSCAVVGGGEDLRRYWSEYMRRTHILVYVVDSADRSRLPLAKDELHRLLGVGPQMPVVILGNKQVKKIFISVHTYCFTLYNNTIYVWCSDVMFYVSTHSLQSLVSFNLLTVQKSTVNLVKMI